MISALVFGPHAYGGDWHRLQSRVFDIDVVTDVHSLMVAYLDGAMSRAGVDENGRLWSKPVEELIPKIIVRVSDGGVVDYHDYEIDPSSLHDRPVAERSNLHVIGAGVSLRLTKNEPIFVGRLSEEADDLFRAIIHRLEGEGRRLIQWRRWLPALPVLFATAYTITSVSVILTSQAGPALNTLVGLSATAIVLAAALGARAMYRRYRDADTGPRIREGSRAETRSRLANARATLTVSLFTVPIGAVIGAIATTLLSQ